MATAHPAAQIEALLAAQGLYPACRTAPSKIRRLFTAQDIAADRQRRLANEYCTDCPLKDACLQFGFSQRWAYGIYGGTWIAAGQPVSWDELARRRGTPTEQDRDPVSDQPIGALPTPRPDWDKWAEKLRQDPNPS